MKRLLFTPCTLFPLFILLAAVILSGCEEMYPTNPVQQNESAQLAPGVLNVDIDIKPGSYPNSINLGSNGEIPVAILTTDVFDASTVNPSSVALEGAGAALRGKSGRFGALEDVDGDGDLDLVVQIETEELPETLESGDACLTGFTWDGVPIEGCDSIIIVRPE